MGLKILSCGAGMQSTALALISCAQVDGPVEHPEVPRYDAVIYCDLGIEPEWVARQVAFLEDACTRQGIPIPCGCTSARYGRWCSSPSTTSG